MVLPGALGFPDRLVGFVEAAPGSGPGDLAEAVCGARTRVLTVGPQLGWIQQHT